jgi:serine protease Do
MSDSAKTNQLRKKPYTAQDLFEIVVDTVVGIQTEDGSGSGVIIDSNGVIATNHHVVGDCFDVIVRLKDNTQLNGQVVRSYKDVDLAFVKIKLDKSPSFFSSLISSMKAKVLLCNRPLKVGEAVFAIGHPLGLEFTLTQGIVSSAERSINGAKYVQIDASINPGNSGGALYSIYAELLGINTMVLSGAQGLNFAIPASIISERYKEFLSEQSRGLINYCNTCGHSSGSEKYCGFCGSSLQSRKSTSAVIQPQPKQQEQGTAQVCSSCGLIATKKEKYCPACGSNVEAIRNN